MRGIAEAAVHADLLHREFGGNQQLLGMVDAGMDQAGGEAAARVLMEQAGQIAGIDVQLIGDILGMRRSKTHT